MNSIKSPISGQSMVSQRYKFDIGSVVRLKKAVRGSEAMISKGQVGMVSDVLVSSISGETSYVVAFQNLEDYAMVKPKELKPFVARGAEIAPPPKVIDDA